MILEFYNTFALMKKDRESEMRGLWKEKWIFYKGKAPAKIYKDTPFDFKLTTKEEINMFIDADEDIRKLDKRTRQALQHADRTAKPKSKVTLPAMPKLKEESLVLQRLPKTIDLTIDYLNAGRSIESFARAKVNKIGRRYASVSVKTWQDEPKNPFALASAHVCLAASGSMSLTST